MLSQPGSAVQAKADHTNCRSCGHIGLHAILDYGQMPASDRFLQPGEDPSVAPLELAFCTSCALLQLLDAPPAAELFGADYLYQSSCSDSWLAQARVNADTLIDRFTLGEDDLVLELASNDGYLLQYFSQRGIPVLGVDPAPVPAAIARQRGVATEQAFFTRELAQDLRARGVQARLVIANNVLAHAEDPLDFAAGVRDILEPNGTWIIEVPHATALVDGTAFDTVYHEHRCYFSLHSLQQLIAQQGFTVVDIQSLPSHGGSLRVFASLTGTPSTSVQEWLQYETSEGVMSPAYFEAFAKTALLRCQGIATTINQLAAQDKKIAVYGAAAKGTILLNCLGDACRHLLFAVDRNTSKHGRRIPGVDLPIRAVESIDSGGIDYLLLLPWNLEQEVLAQQADYCRGGGRFLVPLPEPRIVGASTA